MTDTKSQQQENITKDYSQEIGRLFTDFPKCFQKPPKPLAQGIHKALFQHYHSGKIFSKTVIRKLIRYYTHSTQYHKTILTNNFRIDLNGMPAGKITDQDRLYAEKSYKKIISQKIKKKLTTNRVGDLKSKDSR